MRGLSIIGIMNVPGHPGCLPAGKKNTSYYTAGIF
jgi:hypothetical protein